MNTQHVHEQLAVRLQRKREQQKKETLLLLGFLTLLLGCWLWYTFIFGRSPERAVEQLQSSVKNHDIVLFQERFAQADILDAALNDLTASLIDDDLTLSDAGRQRCTKFYQLIKPQLLAGLRKSLEGYVEKGSWQPPSSNDLVKGRALAVDYERLLERSKLRTTEIVEIAKPVKHENTASVDVKLREKQTKVEFVLRLNMAKQKDGRWQVVSLANYRDYLDAVLLKQNKDIADYIAATVDTVSQSNRRLDLLQTRFKAITRRAKGDFTGSSLTAMENLINGDVIPCLKARQASLDAVPVPGGAQYLSELRQQSTELDIAAWQHYLSGLRQSSPEELNKAETLKEQVLETELRISDIINHRTVGQALPQLP